MPHHVPDVVNQPYDNPPTEPRASGSAGYASVEALSGMENNESGRMLGTGTGGTVAAPQSQLSSTAESVENASSERALSKEEADQLYEVRIQEEYAKREGGA